MTPERLNKIRRLVAAGQSPVPSVVQELINEIDRLRAERQAWTDRMTELAERVEKVAGKKS